jgi:anti-sigma regulatory factor (Ser/Thr protein kinase)
VNTIPLPPSLDARAALDFAAGLADHLSAPLATVDFTSLRSIEPFGLLYVGAALRTFFQQREYRGIGAQGVRAGEPAHEYLAHVGFFQWLGIAVGNIPGYAAGGATWLPVTTLTRAELEKRITETGKPLGSVIHQECERLARLVTQSSQLKVIAPLAYCLREVIRNVFEHAEIDRCVLCAQKCTDGSVELAVIDQGRGIRRSLEERLQFASDSEALRNALRPGVSRCPSTDPDNPWGNSGFGLFVLSELGRELGVFRVVSGKAGLHLTNGDIYEETAALSGTAIQLRLRRPKGANLLNYIETIIGRGEIMSDDRSAPRASASTRHWG